MISRRFVRAYPPAPAATGEAIWLPFRNGELIVRAAGDRAALLRGENVMGAEALYLGTLDGVPCFACEVSGDDSDDTAALDLRALYDALADDVEYGLAGYAAQLLHWRRNSRFCPACGQPAEGENGTWGRRCTACGHVRYPLVTPAVLILVHDGGDGILLASKPGWGSRHSILAGFVEPGESLEECAVREVHEEVGVAVGDLVYAGSQPWPFPHQLMVGFTARADRGELRLDETELAHAAWFSAGDLPELPPPLSLSRQMIDAWVASRR